VPNYLLWIKDVNDAAPERRRRRLKLEHVEYDDRSQSEERCAPSSG